MRYISLLFALLFLFSCGKKTEPISKDMLENTTPPANVQLTPGPEGVTIRNNEEAILLVEKGIPVDGVCSEYRGVEILEPMGSFTDTDVLPGTQYIYRLTKRTLQYKLESAPVLRPLIYSIPPNILNASFERDEDILTVNVEPDADFMRMDIYSGRKSIVQTGYTTAFVPVDEIRSDSLKIVLTDIYGNKGRPYELVTAQPEAPVPPPPVTGLEAVYVGGLVRIVWDLPDEKNHKYEVNVCSNVSCETETALLPYFIYKKEFDKCIDITVYALSADGRSEGAKTVYCKE